MQISRRHIATLTAAAATTAVLSAALPTPALADDQADVDAVVDALRKAMLAGDGAALKDLLADQLTYVHSSGKVENKTEVIDIVGGKKTVYKTIAIEDQKTSVTGTNAVVRHVFSGEAESGGKVNPFKVGVMQVWQKQEGKWRLLARQAFRLT